MDFNEFAKDIIRRQEKESDYDAFMFGLSNDIKEILYNNGAIAYNSLSPNFRLEERIKEHIKEVEEELDLSIKDAEKTGRISGRALAAKLHGREKYLENIRNNAKYIYGEDNNDYVEQVRAEIINYIQDTSKELDFQLPSKYFSLRYKIGVGDMDSAYLIDPLFTGYLFIDFPRFENVENIATVLSKDTSYPVLAISEVDRFSFPKLILYDNAEIIKKSLSKGTENYESYNPSEMYENMAERFSEIMNDVCNDIE